MEINNGKLNIEMGPIRPPSESHSLLLRVTRNCSWNKCEFCHTYKGEPFSIRSVEEIQKDIDQVKNIADEIRQLSWNMGLAGKVNQTVLQVIFGQPGTYSQAFQSVAAWLYFGGHQAFLQDANSLVVKTADLITVLKHLKEKLPSIQRVTSYGRARTLARKSVKELQELQEAGLSRIHIGMESGYDPLLAYMRKGVTAKELIQAGRNVVESGISLSEYIIPGLGGKRWWREHAAATAKVLNQIDPDFIRLRTLCIRPNMPLYGNLEKGDFVRLADEEVIEEIKLFIEALEGIHSTVVSDHILNLLEEVEGKLPEEKGKMIEAIARYRSLGNKERLLFRLGRRLGYYRRLDDLNDEGLRDRLERMIGGVPHANCGDGASEELEKEINHLMENYI